MAYPWWFKTPGNTFTKCPTFERVFFALILFNPFVELLPEWCQKFLACFGYAKFREQPKVSNRKWNYRQ
jgi:hypothetical protein